MDRNKVIELLVKSGLIEPDYIHRCSVISEFEKFALLVKQETLNKAAEYFDERGKNKDGEWSSGYYEVDEPGEILRSLKISY